MRGCRISLISATWSRNNFPKKHGSGHGLTPLAKSKRHRLCGRLSGSARGPNPLGQTKVAGAGWEDFAGSEPGYWGDAESSELISATWSAKQISPQRSMDQGHGLTPPMCPSQNATRPLRRLSGSGLRSSKTPLGQNERFCWGRMEDSGDPEGAEGIAPIVQQFPKKAWIRGMALAKAKAPPRLCASARGSPDGNGEGRLGKWLPFRTGSG